MQLKTHFSLPKVLLDLQKYILSGTIKCLSGRSSSQGNLSLFELTRAPEYCFPENLRRSLKYYDRKTFSDSSIRHIFSSENFRFSFPTKNNLTLGVKFKRLIVGIFLELYLNGTDIQKFLAFFQLLKILGNFCFSEKNNLQKTVNGYLQGSLDQSLTDRCKHF